MSKFAKGFLRLLTEIVVTTVLIIGIDVFTEGMYLFGLPDLDDIRSVDISYPTITDDVKELSSREDMELALKLTGFLKYDLFQKADGAEGPLITIAYHLKDGTDRTISANDTTVWWNNKAYALKDKELFVNLTEGLFFPDAPPAA